MKKYTLTLAIAFGLLLQAQAALVVENVYKKVNADSATFDFSFGSSSAPILTFNYFAIPGSLSITGKTSTDYNSSLLADAIGGNNFHPTLLYNSDNAAGKYNYTRTNIFLYNNNLTFTNKFAGKGNNYIGGRILYPQTGDTTYFWVLINLNSAGTELNIIKVGYEDEFNTRVLTGTEGQTKPTTGLSELAMPVLNVYPQPAREQIQIGLEQSKITGWSVYTLNGELVATSQEQLTTIDVRQMPAGVYLLRVETDAAVLSKRILIQ